MACIGLLAFAGMLLVFPDVLQGVRAGIAWPKAAPMVLGALLLLIASVGLLLRRPEHGWIYAVAAITLLLGLFWLPSLRQSLWPWLAVLAACAGAIIGFRTGRGDRAAD
ncbi:hypothetical protein Y882_04845 [Dyella japonica DSM 16301]|uniref:DUF4175 domain-containing protein n=1 Tax=Dyella japonica DSM 16301 TaxID=1440762 RepID=A0A0G9HBI2_9GAMM|nr:hypothetical protein Y882_04845 [Dyella japonica DSM 16301]